MAHALVTFLHVLKKLFPKFWFMFSVQRPRNGDKSGWRKRILGWRSKAVLISDVRSAMESSLMLHAIDKGVIQEMGKSQDHLSVAIDSHLAKGDSDPVDDWLEIDILSFLTCFSVSSRLTRNITE